MEIFETREKLRSAVRRIWRWPKAPHDCTAPEPPSEQYRGGRESCIRRGQCDVSDANDAAIDALVRFERADARLWAYSLAEIEAELARIIAEVEAQ